MILDSSVIVALIKGEPDAQHYKHAILSSIDPLKMSAASYLEVGIVIDRNGAQGLSALLDALIRELRIEIVPVSPEQARVARDAHRAFGRWSESKAKLNFGDCFVYALARTTGEKLLFKGNDFAHTDLVLAN